MPKPPRAKRYDRDPVTGVRTIAREFQMEDGTVTITLLDYTRNPPGERWDFAHAVYQVADLATTGTIEWDGTHWVANGRRQPTMGAAALVALGR